MGAVFFHNPGLLIISHENGPTGLSIAQVDGGDSETEAPSFQMPPSRVAFTNKATKANQRWVDKSTQSPKHWRGSGEKAYLLLQ